MRKLPRWCQALLALSLVSLCVTVSDAQAATKNQASKPAASQTKSSAKPAKRKATAQVSKSEASHRGRHGKKAHAEAKPADKSTAKATSKPSRDNPKATSKGSKARGRTAKRDVATKHPPAAKPCSHDPVTIVRGADNHSESIVLTRCDGRPVQGAADRLTSLLAPSLSNTDKAKGTSKGHSAGHTHKLDTGLVSRLQAIAAHYPGKSIRVASSYRPLSGRSLHHSGKAVDMVVTGVSNEDLVSFCKTLPDTGCGYYPNSTFVHVDVRPTGAGHVYWIDASKPGESARYVTSWPEKNEPAAPPPADVEHHDEHGDKHQAPAHGQPISDTPSSSSKDLLLDSKEDRK